MPGADGETTFMPLTYIRRASADAPRPDNRRVTRRLATVTLVGLVAAALLAVFVVHLVERPGRNPPVTGGGQVSWTSGVFPGNGIDVAAAQAFGGYRGCPVQIAEVFPGAKTWAQLADQTWYLSAYRGFPGRLSIGVPLTMSGTSLGQVSVGAGDRAFTAFAEHLIRFGRGDSDLRLGWEFNGDWQTWSAFNAREFDGAFRHAAALLKKLLPNATIDWNGNVGHSQAGHNPFSELYPGNDVVDVVGVDAYDNGYNASADSAEGFRAWAAEPFGIDTWYRFAQRHGKKFALPEWGLTATGEGDNPAFIAGMYSWLQQHSSGIAYESYFNQPAGSLHNSLHDPNQMPKSSAVYATLWNGGSACR